MYEMMSTRAGGRLLLRHTPTLQILGRRLWGRTAGSNFVRHINPKSIAAHHLPAAASATFGIARFSSEAPAAQLENDDSSESLENKDAESTVSTSLNCVDEDGVLPDGDSEDLVANEQNDVFPTEEASIDSTDGLVVDGNGATTEDEPAASDDADSAETISKKSQSTDENINDLSSSNPDEVIRTGVIQWLE